MIVCTNNMRIKYELELKEFMCKLKQEEINERKNHLSWKPKLGERPVSYEMRAQILQERECSLEIYKNVTEGHNFGEPGKYEHQITIPSDLAPPPIRTFPSDILQEDWVFRQIILNKFIQAARKIIVKARLEKNLEKLKRYIRSETSKYIVCAKPTPKSDLVATYCAEIPPTDDKIDIVMDVRARKFAKIHQHCGNAKEANYELLDITKSSAPLRTRSDYKEPSLAEANIMSFKPSTTFEKMPYNDEDLFILNKNENNSEPKMSKTKEQKSDKEISSTLSEKNENENPYSPSNLPTLDGPLYTNKCQDVLKTNPGEKEIFDEKLQKSFLSKSTISSCIFNYLALDKAAVALKKKPEY